MFSDPEQVRSGFARLSNELGSGELVAKLVPVPDEIPGLRACLLEAPKTDWRRLGIALNRDQVESKIWLVEELTKVVDPSAVRFVVLGAWYGIFSFILHAMVERPPREIVCVDIDEGACRIARQLACLLSPQPKIVRADMLEINYTELSAGRPTVFVNTSCEHLGEFSRWRAQVPNGSFLVLQSNDHRGCSEHVNCVSSLEEFEQQALLSRIDFGGSLRLERFQRFMLIGRA